MTLGGRPKKVLPEEQLKKSIKLFNGVPGTFSVKETLH